MRRYEDVAFKSVGNAVLPLNGATVTVRVSNPASPGTGALATIYSDDGSTAIAGSAVTCDSVGRFSFYAPDGKYDLTVSGTGVATPYTQADVEISDLTEQFSSDTVWTAKGLDVTTLRFPASAPDVSVSRGAANRLDLASGDKLQLDEISAVGIIDNVYFVDGVKHTTAQAAINAAQSALGLGLVVIPSSYAGASPTSYPEDIVVLDLRNSLFITNTHQRSPYLLTSKFGAGTNNGITLATELETTGGSFTGALDDGGENAALYAGAKRTAGSRGIWAANFLLHTTNLSTSPAYGLEIDVDNTSGVDATASDICDGLFIVSGQANKPRSALIIGKGGSSANFLHGINITNACDTAINIQSGMTVGLNTQSVSTFRKQASPAFVRFIPQADNDDIMLQGENNAESLTKWLIRNSGKAEFQGITNTVNQLLVSGIAQNSVKIVPGADDTNTEIYGTNAADSATKWKIQNDGGATFAYIVSSTGSVQAPAFLTNQANPATTGLFRFANADQACWRNGANSANVCAGIVNDQFSVRRYRSSGTALVSGDFALHANWGNTASVGSIVGTDQGFEVTVTSAGTGQGTNPTLTLTFKDGTWTNPPVAVCSWRAGGTGTITDLSTTATATTLAITYNGTPVDTQTYPISCILMGR